MVKEKKNKKAKPVEVVAGYETKAITRPIGYEEEVDLKSPEGEGWYVTHVHLGATIIMVDYLPRVANILVVTWSRPIMKVVEEDDG